MKRWPLNALISLAVGVGIVTILLYFPVFGRYTRSRPDELLSRLHRLYVAASLYQADYNAFPDMSTPGRLQAALSPHYLLTSDTFQNPFVPGPIHGNPALSGRKAGKLWADEHEIALFWALNGRTDRPISAITIDGHSHPYTLREWGAMKKRSRIP